MFVGYVQLEDTIPVMWLSRDVARAPINTDSAPTFRVYGPDGLLPLVSGSAVKLDTGAITGASNATPVVVTSANHGLTTGTQITVSGVVGNTAANATFTVTKLTDSTFELDGSSGNADYVSGGVWNVTGLYSYEVDATAANGFEAGTSYYVLIQGAVAGVATSDTQVFIVT